MWPASAVTIEIEDEGENGTLSLIFTTPLGKIDFIGQFELKGRVLYINTAHIDGLSAGALGLKGLYALARSVMEQIDVDKIIIQGGTRTTGKRKGQKPRPIVFERT